MTEVTMDELLAAMQAAGFNPSDQGEGLTTNELAEAWKCPRDKVRALLANAKKLGVLIVGRKSVERLDGQSFQVACYSFDIAKTGTKRKGRK